MMRELLLEMPGWFVLLVTLMFFVGVWVTFIETAKQYKK